MDGPDLAGTEMNMEQKSKPKSLTGMELSSDWPLITPDTEYAHRFENFDPKIDHPIDRFSIDLKQGSKELKYLAVEHTSNPENPQFAALESSFNSMTPHVVLHEGPGNVGRISDRETAMKYGEVGFMAYLVQQHNGKLQPGERPIEMESTDMPDSEWVKAFQQHHTNEEIAVYDILRKVNVTAEQIRRNNNLSDEQRTTALGELTTQINNDFIGYVSERQFPNLFTRLPRKDEREWNAETIKEEVKRLTGRDLSADLNQLQADTFKKMFEEEMGFRDKYVVGKIADKVRQNDKVMAIMGSSHVLREEFALKQLFDVSEQPEAV